MPNHDFKSPRLYLDADLVAETPVPATPVQANYLLNKFLI